MRLVLLVLVCWMPLAAACRVSTVEPTPLYGPTPRTVVVWPRLLPAGGPDDAEDLLLPLDAALRRRGYQVPSVAVVERMLLDRGLAIDAPDAAAAAALSEWFAAEAIMVVEVRQFVAREQRPRSARWDLEWRLLATENLAVLWAHTHHGSWRQSEVEPLREEMFSRDDGVSFPARRSTGVVEYRDTGELVAALHRLAMDHMPPRGR